jgi:hypothetical protein
LRKHIPLDERVLIGIAYLYTQYIYTPIHSPPHHTSPHLALLINHCYTAWH